MNKIHFAAAVILSAGMISGCGTDDTGHDFGNRVFISATSFDRQIRVQTDEKVDELSSEITVKMASPESRDIDVTFRQAPELLDRYRMAYYDEGAELLPDGHCSLKTLSAVITAGNIESEPVEVAFTGLLGLDYTKNYVMPVTIDDASGIDVLESARTLYFVIKEASLINIVADIYQNCAWPDWENFDEVADMETFTMEALVKGSAFSNESSVHTIMGIEDLFLVRVGDTTIPKNQLQIATAKYLEEDNSTLRDNVSNPSMKLNTDRWYHIAVTFERGIVKVYIDGKLKGEGDFSEKIGLTSVNFKVKHSDESNNQPRCFWIGYSYDSNRSFNGSIAEVRMWNRVLSEEEINSENHFYKINLNDSEAKKGLVAYWKFNDGSGNKVKDYSQYGNDLEAASSIVWKDVDLPEKGE